MNASALRPRPPCRGSLLRRGSHRASLALAFVALIATGCKNEPPPAAPESGGAPAAEPTADAPPTAAADSGGTDTADGGTTAVPADAPAAEEVLAQAVDALGGQAALDKVESYYSEASMEVTGQNITAQIKLWWKGGDFYMETDMAGAGQSRVWKKGETIWAEDPINGKRKLEGKEAAQTSWSASLSLAADWQRYFESAQTVGVRSAGGFELVDVRLTDKHGTSIVLSFDAKTGLPREQSFVQATPMGDMEIRTTLEDYRDAGGVKTPYKSVTAMSLFSSVQTVSKFEVNVPVDTAKFSP